MKPVRLTRRAERRLNETAAWTTERFGLAQAKTYESSLLKAVSALSHGTAVSRSCGALVPEHRHAPGLRCILIGRHYLVLLDEDDMIIVLDFTHASRNFVDALDELHRD